MRKMEWRLSAWRMSGSQAIARRFERDPEISIKREVVAKSKIKSWTTNQIDRTVRCVAVGGGVVQDSERPGRQDK